MNLTEEQALRAYANMMNSLDASHLEALLADDFRYASQWVFAEIESKAAYLEYIVPKLEAIRKSGTAAWAEMAWLDREFLRPCVVMAQGGKDKPRRGGLGQGGGWEDRSPRPLRRSVPAFGPQNRRISRQAGCLIEPARPVFSLTR